MQSLSLFKTDIDLLCILQTAKSCRTALCLPTKAAFRVNCISDGILGITVSPVCETVSALPVSKLSAFLNEKYDERGSLADIMLDYAKKHPYIIKPYIDDYPVLKIVKV